MTNFWSKKRVLVTGGLGFIGGHLVEKLIESGAVVSVLDNVSNPSLRKEKIAPQNVTVIRGECKDETVAEHACKNIDVVMHLAAKVAGVDYNRQHKGTMLSENLLIQTVMLEAARRVGVDRFLAVSSAVVYPADAKIPTPESEGFRGEPEEANG